MTYLKSLLFHPWDADKLFLTPKTTLLAIGLTIGGAVILWLTF